MRNWANWPPKYLTGKLQTLSLLHVSCQVPGNIYFKTKKSISVFLCFNKYRQVEFIYELCRLVPIMQHVIYRWTQTQSRTLTQQLDMGIRYLDLRVIARKDAREEKHVFVRNGPSILLVLKEIRRWLDLHPREVVLIDFRL